MVNRDRDRVRHQLLQATAVTGRLASSDPNLQNILVRNCRRRRIAPFIAPPGKNIVSADYSQIELHIMAHFRGPGLLDAFAKGRRRVLRHRRRDLRAPPRARSAASSAATPKVINFPVHLHGG